MAQTVLQQFTREVAAAFEDRGTGFDLWLSPTLNGPTPALGELVATEEDPTVAEARSARWVAIPLVVANITGRAAMSLPLSFDTDGLPIGVHLMGGYGGEATLLRLAAEVERVHPWHRVWPPLSTSCLPHQHV